MSLHWYNRNAVGTHFGGSLYAMVDPHVMLMLMQLLGKDYWVWDKSAEIEFVKAGKGKVSAVIAISDGALNAIRLETREGKKYFPVFDIEVKDETGALVARITKTLYVRKKSRRSLMEAKRIPSIKINFMKSPHHKTHPVSGVWGGATPQGDIHCNFYIEHPEIPATMDLEMDMATGKAIEKIPKSEKVYVREILTSVILRPDIAMSIGKWLIKKAETIHRSRQLSTQEPRGTIQ